MKDFIPNHFAKVKKETCEKIIAENFDCKNGIISDDMNDSDKELARELCDTIKDSELEKKNCDTSGGRRRPRRHKTRRHKTRRRKTRKNKK
jgi:hypothetical protein